MIKRLRNALVLALLLPLATMSVADARPGGSSFRGGFSSQKSAAARSSAAPKQPSFGSFGSRKPDAAPASKQDSVRGSSAASRDLDQRASQDRALRNWDSRNSSTASSGSNGSGAAGSSAANHGTTALPPLNPVQPGGSSYSGYGQAGAPMSPAPVVIRERSGSSPWLWGLGGYLLGSHALSRAQTVPAPAPSSAPSTTTISTDDAATGAVSNDAAGGVAQSLPSTAPAAKQERSTIRTLTWALLIFGFAWLLWIGWRRNKSAKKNANYSFERN
ncbi:hypothetical protein [Pseudoduganella sp. RAF53_2]|uniref:hypothetical protein n=1 Tax=unclassified Pseudoduganella TaxID=2637179 RepID=UPI003F9BD477